MKKPKEVYHGGGKELKGAKLIPKKATDLGNKPSNVLVGIYASDLREEAIAMGILSCKGVKSSSCGVYGNKNPVLKAIIYEGWPKQDYFYLYTLPSETFENNPKESHQYVSLKPVKPKKVERLLVKDYLHLIKKATDKEKKAWMNKYVHKLNII